ncbi:hypothetical protein CAI21_07770 [Alkalilimnicola ehrlichii]|uniref:Phage shock protein A, PspA n=1 Tax=Alkalilimnicola ehrlichii TaxID=351052 RepID=A0A3E0WZK3_9GAMM|nr:PspA/IM30 family protein [Alkalilimnicola ehrlichii]RFA30090.1 hypothetical protein CAI21_07770 [Alkalilimnicola ehrlichii]RFA37435.1 hypothetical protein CAL65_09110 [Alkalilimnicola ehrlichii]
MNWMRQIFTAFKGSINEAGESVADATAITRFEQELREARDAMRRAERSLTAAKADELGQKRKVEQLREQLTLREGQARTLLTQGNETLAAEVADEMVRLQDSLAAEADALAYLTEQVRELQTQINEGRQNVESMQRELNIVKTTEAVQKATADASSHLAGIDSKGSRAMESLERIRQRQAHRRDRLTAARELAAEGGSQSLDQKLKEAGVTGRGDSAQDILARLRQENPGS